MGLFDWMGKDPSKAANKYLEQIPGTIKPYYDPYINAGNRALPNLENQYGRMTSDPGSLYNELGKGYQKSPGYDFALKQALGSANSAAASGGMAGSPMHEQWAMDTSSGLASRDFDKYMQEILGLYGQGLQGEEGLYKTGFGASDALSRALSENLQNQGSNAAAGAQWKNKMNLGLTGLGLTGAFDYMNPGSGSNTGSSGGSEMGALAKFLPYLMSM